LGILVRGVDACARAGDRRGAEARFDRLRLRIADDRARFAGMLGRGAASLLIAGFGDAAIIRAARAWIDAIGDGEDSPLRAPRDVCRMAFVAGLDPKRALAMLLENEID